MEFDLCRSQCQLDNRVWFWRIIPTWLTAGTISATDNISSISGIPELEIPIDLARPARFASSMPFHVSLRLSLYAERGLWIK